MIEKTHEERQVKKELDEFSRQDRLKNEHLRRLSFSIAGSKHGARKVRKILRSRFVNPIGLNKREALKIIGNWRAK